MLADLWTRTYRSICSITAFESSKRIGSGTGFKVGNRLVTNYHVVQLPTATQFEFRFVGVDSQTDSISKVFSTSELLASTSDSMPIDSWDYIILDPDWAELAAIPSLTLASNDQLRIGQPIALFGYQFDQANLSIHSGILSSRFVVNGVKILQVDASVNQGNSGGPLVDPINSQVIGIVTRKLTGLTEEFDKLMESFARNVKVLEQSRGSVRIMVAGIDPIEALRLTQAQMARVSIEIKRAANVGVGYAYEVEKIRQGIQK